MNRVASLYIVTKELHDVLAEPIHKDNRDEPIEKITELLHSRDSLIGGIQPPYTVEEKKLGTEIVRLNEFIDKKLEEIKQTIQLDITQLSKNKKSTNKYANPYESGPADGMFFDKRN